jgi:hypothetical protein
MTVPLYMDPGKIVARIMKSLSTYLRAGLLAAMIIISAVIVSQDAVTTALASPYSGNPPTPTNLTVYFHNLSTPVTVGGAPHLHIANTLNDTVAQYANSGDNISATHYLSLNFTLYPQLSGPLQLNGTMFTYLYMTQNGSAPTSGHITMSLYLDAPNGTSQLVATGPATSTNVNYPGTAPTLIRITGPTVNMTVKTNFSLSFVIVVSGGTSQIYNALWGNVKNTYYFSEAVISASSYLEVSSMYAVNSAGAQVYSLTSNATNKTVTVYANVTDPLGAYDFYSWPVDYVIRNSTATVGSGVMTAVTVFSVNGYFVLYKFEFNYSGFALGIYTITVNGTDNTMHNYLNSLGVIYGRNAHGSMQLSVGLPPVRAVFTVEDSLGKALTGAVVKAYYSVSFIASNHTNGTGVAGLFLFGGNYTVDVYWQSVNVGTFAVTVNNTSYAFTLKSKVYSPTYIFEDQSGMPLADAFVYLTSPNGTALPLLITSGSGSYPLIDMAGGNYSTVVYWHSSLVFSGFIDFNANGNIPVNVNAFSQAFKVISASGTPVPTANILIVNTTTGTDIGFNTTNASGLASSVIPYGSYSVLVYWKGILVYQNSQVLLNNPTAPAMVLNASIYTVTVRAVTAAGQPLGNVVVDIYSNETGTVLSAVTSGNGYATFEVAGGNYAVTASFSTTYDLTPVSQKLVQSLSVSGATELTMKFTQVYPPITATNLFYLIIALVVIIVVAITAIAYIAKKSNLFRKSEENKKEGQ